MHRLARYLDPRRGLAAATGWLVFALSIGLVLVASTWVGSIVHTNLLDQRSRQLHRTADRIAAALNLDLALRLQSLRALAAMLAPDLHEERTATLRRIFEDLQNAYPEFEWIGVANAQGRVLAATAGLLEGTDVSARAWFARGLTAPAIGVVRRELTASGTRVATGDPPGQFVDLIAPVTDANAHALGVIGAQLSRRWLLTLASGLRHEVRAGAGTESLLLDPEGTVLIGPADLQGKRWQSTIESPDAAMRQGAANAPPDDTDEEISGIERLADGTRYLVAHAKPAAADALQGLGLRILVLQPLQDATQRARTLQRQIGAVLLGLGLLAALVGVLLARRITRGLNAIARSADLVRAGAAREIAVPAGQSEAARLGHALDDLLTSLQRERGALHALNVELDQRVAARTREIERLAEQARYAAVVRERLKIARDLHDTLAHSMMAMLAQIRLLRRLSATDPNAMAEELARAEEAAHQGLKEARAAIAQMRFNPVRDAGLAAALSDFAKLFVERTGIPVDYTSDAPPGAFADERAETLFRIAEEAMRNVERHARATRATIALRASADGNELTLTITDDGVGFDATAAHPGHYGLTGLREQARLIGAVLTIRSAPRQGTTISIALAPAS